MKNRTQEFTPVSMENEFARMYGAETTSGEREAPLKLFCKEAVKKDGWNEGDHLVVIFAGMPYDEETKSGYTRKVCKAYGIDPSGKKEPFEFKFQVYGSFLPHFTGTKSDGSAAKVAKIWTVTEWTKQGGTAKGCPAYVVGFRAWSAKDGNNTSENQQAAPLFTVSPINRGEGTVTPPTLTNTVKLVNAPADQQRQILEQANGDDLPF